MDSRIFQQSPSVRGHAPVAPAVAALVSAVAVPPIALFAIAKLLLPGVPLSAGNAAFWLVLTFAGLLSFAIVRTLPRVRVVAALGLGAAFGVACVLLWSLALNLLPLAGGAI